MIAAEIVLMLCFLTFLCTFLVKIKHHLNLVCLVLYLGLESQIM